MEFLARHGRKLWLLAGLLLTACLMFEPSAPARRGAPFPHALHGDDKGLDCNSCHRDAETADKAGMPTYNQCMLCHKKIDEEKDPEHRATALFEDKTLKGPLVTTISDEVRFSHAAHVAKYQVKCEQCHGNIAETSVVPASARVTMDACTACHARAGKANECTDCHTTIRADRKPEDHLQNWKRFHGQVVKTQGGMQDARCTLCHKERDCVKCHQDEAPQDHTNYWRQRGHALTVSLDRSACNACHRSDFCNRCHEDSAPRSHVGSWGAPRDTHCLTCHFPLRDEGCFTCHKSTPSHALAAPKPPDHSAGMNCRQCHGLSAPLPHVDKGDNCNTCHH